ncbi:hypothetical protein LguiA_025546 [Lonicera macranthoides]
MLELHVYLESGTFGSVYVYTDLMCILLLFLLQIRLYLSVLVCFSHPNFEYHCS